MNEQRFFSQDGSVGVALSPKAQAMMIDLSRRSPGMEIGSILIGKYIEDRTVALVTRVSHCPSDSIREPANFERGNQGLDRVLEEAWAAGEYYVGEWHFHPLPYPQPSSIDVEATQVIATDPSVECPECILVIIAPDEADGFQFTVTLISKDEVRRLDPRGAA